MKHILLIQTGGTIAMNSDSKGHTGLDVSQWSELLFQEVPELSELARIDTKRIFFEDSSDLNPEHWKQLIECISGHYDTYDGFVVLHGTDTMAYTASALSFGLQNLGKPVILTGSQVPMSVIRSDARRNLVNAVEMATLGMPEIAICFNDFVYRGNRATKMSIGDFDAFTSPNYPPLAEIGLNIKLNGALSGPTSLLKVNTSFSNDLLLLKLYPGLDPKILDGLDTRSLRALIIEAFGSGNFPIRGPWSLLPFLNKCIEQGIILVITSQAAYDAVDLAKYQSGRIALELGAVGAKDMTTEAVLAKMMYLLGNYTSAAEIKTWLASDIAGELTE